MLVENSIDMMWNSKTRKHFESRGYVFTKYGDLFKVKIKDIPLGSNKKIKVYCDYCLEEGKETILNIPYYRYIKSRKIVSKDCCKNCIPKKVRDSNLKVYGVENTFQLEEIKEKSKKTQLEKYGMLYSKTVERKEKIKETNLNKYGVENPMQSNIIKEKAKKTNLKKYGVENVFQSREIKEKIKNTISEKYGNGRKLENISQSTHYKIKIKETSMKKFKVPHLLMSKEVRDKIKETNIKKFGFDVATKNPKVLQKILDTMENNGTVKTSKQQIEFFNTLKEYGYECYLNYRYSNLFLDIAIFINEEKINIECDGLYWHTKSNQKDIKRDKFLQSNGWKTIRFVYDKNFKMPSKEFLEDIINNAINGKIFQRILL